MKKISVMDRAKLPLVPLQLTDEDVNQIKPLEKPVTGPGTMMRFMQRDSATFIENEKLKAELENYKGSYSTRKLDAKSVVRSKWANRHEQSFVDKEFLKLKVEIDSSGGNVQPIKVRPLAGEKDKFELVFGHRRHQACLELGLPVLAMIDDLSEPELFAQMDRENRERKDLRPYEQGLMYANALDSGLFPSARKMASSLGLDLGTLGRMLVIARLPKNVLAAFPSPLDIQIKWSSDLAASLEKNPDAVLAQAEDFQKLTPRPDAKTVLAGLIGAGGRTVLPGRKKLVSFQGRAGEVATFESNESEQAISLNVKKISGERATELRKLVFDYLASK